MADQVNEGMRKYFVASNENIRDKNKSLLARGNKLDQFILNYVQSNGILVPISPIEGKDHEGEYKIFKTEVEISRLKTKLYASQLGDEDDADPAELKAYIEQSVQNDAMQQIYSLVQQGHQYSHAVDYLMFGHKLPEKHQALDAKSLSAYNNQELLEKNYSLLKRGNKMDKIILAHVKANQINIPIAPTEDDDRYRVYNRVVEIFKNKGEPYVADLNGADAEPRLLKDYITMTFTEDYQRQIIEEIAKGRSQVDDFKPVVTQEEEADKISQKSGYARVKSFFGSFRRQATAQPGSQSQVPNQSPSIGQPQDPTSRSDVFNRGQTQKYPRLSQVSERGHLETVGGGSISMGSKQNGGEQFALQSAKSTQSQKMRKLKSQMVKHTEMDEDVPSPDELDNADEQLSCKSLRELRPNNEVTFKLVEDLYSELKEKCPRNKFVPNLKNNAIVWTSTKPVTSLMVYEVVKIYQKLDRRILINAGDPTSNQKTTQKNELDMKVVVQQNEQSALHLVQPGKQALLPANIDTIITWSHDTSEPSKRGDPEQPKNATQQPRDVSKQTIKYQVPNEHPKDHQSTTLSKVIPGFYVADMGKDLHFRCDKLFKQLKLIEQALKQDVQADKNDMNVVATWLKWIQVLHHLNEPLTLLVIKVNDVTFPKLSDLATELQIVSEYNPDGQYASTVKMCAKAIEEFGQRLDTEFCKGIAQTIGESFGFEVVLGMAPSDSVKVAYEDRKSEMRLEYKQDDDLKSIKSVRINRKVSRVPIVSSASVAKLDKQLESKVNLSDDVDSIDEDEDAEDTNAINSPEIQDIIKKFNFISEDFAGDKFKCDGAEFTDDSKKEMLDNYEDKDEMLKQSWEELLEDASFYDKEQTEQKLRNLLGEVIHQVITIAKGGGAHKVNSIDYPELPTITQQQQDILIKEFQSGATIKDKIPPNVLKKKYAGISLDDLQQYAQAYKKFNCIFYEREKLSSHQFEQCISMIRENIQYKIFKVENAKQVIISAKDKKEALEKTAHHTLISKHVIEQLIKENSSAISITTEINQASKLLEKPVEELIQLLNANDRSVNLLFKEFFIVDQEAFFNLVGKLRNCNLAPILTESDIVVFRAEFQKPEHELNLSLIDDVLRKYENNVRLYLQLLLCAAKMVQKNEIFKKVEEKDMSNFTTLKYSSKDLVDLIAMAQQVQKSDDIEKAMKIVDKIPRLSQINRPSVKSIFADLLIQFKDEGFDQTKFEMAIKQEQNQSLNLTSEDFQIIQFIYKYKQQKLKIQQKLNELENEDSDIVKPLKSQASEALVDVSDSPRRKDSIIKGPSQKNENDYVDQNDENLNISYEFCQKVCEAATTDIQLWQPSGEKVVYNAQKSKAAKTINIIMTSTSSLQFMVKYVLKDMQFDSKTTLEFLQNYKKVANIIAPWCIGWLKYPSFYKFIVQEGTNQSTLLGQINILGRVYDSQIKYEKSQLPDDLQYLHNVAFRFKNRCTKDCYLFREWFDDLQNKKAFKNFRYEFTQKQSRLEIDWYMDGLYKISEKFPIQPTIKKLKDVNKVTTRLGTNERRIKLRTLASADEVVETIIEILFGIILRREDISQIKNDLMMIYNDVAVSERFLVSFVLQQSDIQLRARILYYLQNSMSIPLIMSCQKTFRNLEKTMKFSHEIALCMKENEGYGIFSMGYGTNAYYQIGKTQMLNDIIFPISGSDSKAFYVKDDNLFSNGQVDIYFERSFETKHNVVVMDGHGQLQNSTINAVLELTNLLLIHVHETNLQNQQELQNFANFVLQVADKHEDLEISILIRDSQADIDQFQSLHQLKEYLEKNLDSEEALTLSESTLSDLFEKIQKWLPVQDMSQMGADKIKRMTALTNIYRYYYSKLESFQLDKLKGKVSKTNFVEKFLTHDNSEDGEHNLEIIKEISSLAQEFENSVNNIKEDFFSDDGLQSLKAKDAVRKADLDIREFSIEQGVTTEKETKQEQELKKKQEKAKQFLSQIEFNDITEQFWTIINHRHASLLKFEIAQRLTQITHDNTKDLLVQREEILKEKMEKDVEQAKKDELIDERQQKLADLANKIYSKSISYDYFWRQLVSLLNDNPYQGKWQDKSIQQAFKDSVFQQMSNGDFFEFIDGRCLEMKADFIKDILGEIEKEKVIIVGVIGPQSTGKSTLMNYSFGTQFLASTGRCTNGIYFTLQKIPKGVNSNAQYLLILDTEGLQSPERGDEEYDRKIVMFTLLSCDLLIINARGDLNLQMAQTIKMCAVQYDKLKAHSSTPNLLFTFVQNTKFDKKPFANQISNLKSDVEAASQTKTIVETAQQLLGYDENKVRVLGNAYQQEYLDKDDENGIRFSNANTICLPIFGVQASEVFDVMKNILESPRVFREIGQYFTEAQQNWRIIEQHGADILNFADLQEYRDDQKMAIYFNKLWLEYTSPERDVDVNDYVKAEMVADELFRLCKAGKTVQQNDLFNKYIQENIEAKDQDFENHIKGKFETWRTLDQQKSIKYNAEKQHMKLYKQKINALKADFQVHVEGRLKELQLAHSNSAGLRSVIVRAKEIAQDPVLKADPHELEFEFDRVWEEVRKAFDSQVQLGQMKISYMNDLIKSFQGACNLLKFSEEQKESLYNYLDTSEDVLKDITQFLKDKLSRDLWDGKPKSQFKLSHEMLKQMNDDCAQRIFDKGGRTPELFVELKDLLSLDYTFDVIDNPGEALDKKFLKSHLIKIFKLRVPLRKAITQRNCFGRTERVDYIEEVPHSELILEEIKEFLICFAAAGFVIEEGYLYKTQVDITSKAFFKQIPCSRRHFHSKGYFQYTEYFIGPDIKEWIQNFADNLKWDASRFTQINPAIRSLFKLNEVKVSGLPDPFIDIDTLKTYHKELHCFYCSDPVIKYYFKNDVKEQMQATWSLEGHITLNLQQVKYMQEIFVHPKTSKDSNDRKWLYLSFLANKTMNWEKLVKEITNIIDINLEMPININESESSYADDDEIIDIKKIIEMNKINSTTAHQIVNKFLNSKILEPLDNELHQKLALHLNPEFSASLTWAAVIICWYRLMDRVKNQYQIHLDRFSRKRDTYLKQFLEIIEGNEQKVTKDSIQTIFMECFTSFESETKNVYLKKINDHLSSEDIKQTFKTTNVYKEVDKIYFQKNDYVDFVNYVHDQQLAFEQYVDTQIQLKIQDWIDINVKNEIDDRIINNLNNLRNRLKKIIDIINSYENQWDQVLLFDFFDSEGNHYDDYDKKGELIKNMSQVFNYLLCEVLNGTLHQDQYEMDIPMNDTTKKFIFEPRIDPDDSTCLLEKFFNMDFGGDPKYDELVESLLEQLDYYRFDSMMEISDVKFSIEHLLKLIDQKRAEVSSRKMDASFFKVDSRVAAYKQQAEGCQSKCKFCGRKCEKEVHPAEVQHECNIVGHQLRVFGGGHVQQADGSMIPSLNRCDGINDDQKILIDGDKKTWKEIKEVQLSNWNIQDLHNTREYRDQDVQFKEFWKKHYKRYCQDQGYVETQEMNISVSHLQISFVIDATSSMRSEIDQAKESVHKQIDNDGIDIQMRCCFYRDHCDEEFLSVFGGIGSTEFTPHEHLEQIREWIDDDEKNGGGAKGGGDLPECALDGLFHEAMADWDASDIQMERMIIHIYDAPPHGDWARGRPDEHCSSSDGNYCCCCNDDCNYNVQNGRGWDSLIAKLKSQNIKYQGLCTRPDSAKNVDFQTWMKKELGDYCLQVKQCGKENVCAEITEIFNFK